MEEQHEPSPMDSFGPGRIVKPVGKQRFRGWEVVGENKIEVVEKLVMWPKEGELLVRVRSCGVSTSDVLQRKGGFVSPVGASPVLGQEMAGEVVATGEGVHLWSVGDRLCCLVPSGGFAEFCICPASQCLPIPKGFSWAESAAVPLACAVSWCFLFDLGKLVKGQTVLVHGGAGGIGHVMVQVAAAFGVRVLTTCRGEEEVEMAKTLGVELAIDLEAQNVVHQVMDHTKGRGVDVVVDIGAVTPQENCACLGLEGKLLLMAVPPDSTALTLEAVFEKRLTVTGCSIRSREPAYKRHLAQSLRQHVWPLLDERKVVPRVHAKFKFVDLHKALDVLEQHTERVLGKIVCVIERTHAPPTALRSDT